MPVRNIPVVMPHFPWHEDEFAADDGRRRSSATRCGASTCSTPPSPVALAAQWEGSATYGRIKAFCAGAVEAMQPHVASGHPLILVFDSDIGGLLGLHFREEMQR